MRRPVNNGGGHDGGNGSGHNDGYGDHGGSGGDHNIYNDNSYNDYSYNNYSSYNNYGYGGYGGHSYYNSYYGHYKHGYYNTHYYGYHPYTHGSYFLHSGYSLGLWIGYRGSSWYYNPTYRTGSYVYASPVYNTHYYYGAGSGSSADSAVAAVDQGWVDLESGRPDLARREFAKAASLTPSWGLPRIGYAIALSASGYQRSAAPQIRRALSEDPYALLEVPWSDSLGSLIVELDSEFTTYAYNGVETPDSWLLAGAMRVLLGDADAAAEAAFNAETAGASSSAVEGLLQVIAGYEAPVAPATPDVVEIVE